MGVHGLWDLLAPVGRRVSVETLSGKKLAIDASIWMVQFMKAMRDERGEMVRNAHLLGFFRRICKLLFLRTKPVFVFDGGTPALKRRTVIARRRQRENAQAKIRKTAEKLLLNHLKSMRLKDLAKDLENQKRKQKVDAKGKQILVDKTSVEDSNMASTYTQSYNQEKLDEMLAASIAAEENRHLNNSAATYADAVPGQEEEDSDENEEILMPAMDGNVDPAVLAALPTSMQLDLKMRGSSMVQNRRNEEEVQKDEGHKGDAMAKKDLSNEMDILGRDHLEAKGYSQEKIDEMLAASITAEEDESLTHIASTSAAKIPAELEVEDEDEDEEMLFPALCGKVDPAVLAALPPSMQLDLLVQMRERLMADNRQRYQKVKKAPEKFSNLQIDAYLKTVAFRREIDQVQKAAAGKNVGGVQTSRIASEANKEFIFSSSFMGDKQLLTSAGVRRNGNNSSDSMDHVASTSKSSTEIEFVQNDTNSAFDEDVETYVDERGRTRVSRVRAMGIRMTRDLQRNLDLMKEIERENRHNPHAQSELSRDKIDSLKSIPGKKQNAESSHDNNANSVKSNQRNGQPILNSESSMQISFEVGGDRKCTESDDDIFTSLVAGQPVMISSVGSGALRGQSPDSASDGDWEEGIIEGRDNGSSKDEALETNPPDSNISDDSEVEWEEGVDVHENSVFLSESGKPASRGYLEEEADLQEAIRRSLEDVGGEKFSHTPPLCQKLMSTSENAHKSIRFLDGDANTGKLKLLEKDQNRQNKHLTEISAIGGLDSVGQTDFSNVISSSQRQFKLSEAHDTDNLDILTKKSGESDMGSNAGQLKCNMNIGGNLGVESISADSATTSEAKEIDLTMRAPLDAFVDDVGLSTSKVICSGEISHDLKAASCDMHILVDEDNQMETRTSLFVNEEKKSEPPSHSVVLTNPVDSFKDSTMGTDVEPVLAVEKNPVQFNRKEHLVDKFANNENLQGDMSEANLQEEILDLDQERKMLGSEQKKLERNAESVSSEMFAECQELLQMFGLPYIIAPMEAEAQCAYMELANLVDGVVTDDSDVFLFGARSVYKNIFDDRKYVETYFMKDIEKELGLTREKLIRMALLLGSDYTEGISGIGIVNAIEVVNAFPEEDGLQKFQEWIELPDPNILGKFDAQTGFSTRKKGPEVGDHGSNCENSNMEGINLVGENTLQDHGQECSADHSQQIKQIFMNKHRNVSKNWHVPSSFPSEAVISAYLCPQVDKSTDPFTWGKPDKNVLRRICWEKFGWSIQKSDELLLPVLKEYNKHETQLRLEAFYTFNERFAKIRSNRIKKAVKEITGNQSLELMDDAVKESTRNKKKRTIRPGESGDNNPEAPSKRAKAAVQSSKTNSLGKSTRNQSRKRTAGEPVLTEVESTKQSQQGHTQGMRNINKGSHGDGKGKGRGGGCRRGRVRGRGRGRGREKESHGFEQSDSSSVDVSSGDDKLEVCAEKARRPQELRRSMRTRKPANYVLNDSEVDDVSKSLDLENEKSDKEAAEPVLAGDQGVCEDPGISLNCQGDQNVEGASYEDFSKDYLETGGGFINEENETVEGGVSKSRYPCEAGLSEDYLETGGGFCVDESEMLTSQDVAHSPSVTAPMEAADSSFFSSHMEEADVGEDPLQNSNLSVENLNGIQVGENANALDGKLVSNCANATDSDDHSKVILPMPESTVRSSLSAMPFLKRKRRKN